jgi:hypothetical protein
MHRIGAEQRRLFTLYQTTVDLSLKQRKIEQINRKELLMNRVLIFLPVVLLLTFCGGQKQPAPAAVTPETVAQTKDSVPVVRESQSGVKEEAKLKLPKLWDFLPPGAHPANSRRQSLRNWRLNTGAKLRLFQLTRTKTRNWLKSSRFRRFRP